MQTPDDPAAAPPAASDPAAAAAAATQPADPPRSPDTAETPLLKHGHTTYSDSSASSGAATAAESSSAAATSVRARRQSRPPSDGGELFQGLGRGLSAAASMSQKRRGSDTAAGSSNEVTDDSDDELEGGGGSGSRPSALSSRKAGSGSGGLSSPLISPHAPSSSPPSRRQDSVLRRHIKLTNAEFVMTPAERSIAFAEKGFIERRLRPEVQRTDLFRDNFVRSSRYTLFTFLPMNLFEQLSPLNKPAVTTTQHRGCAAACALNSRSQFLTVCVQCSRHLRTFISSSSPCYSASTRSRRQAVDPLFSSLSRQCPLLC